MKNLLKITHSLIHSFTHSKLAITLIISQLAIISCNSFVTTIDPSDLPSTDSKLVLACYISPQDTVISAKVTETKTILGTGGTRDDIKNATVKLSDGTKTVSLIYSTDLQYYRALPSQMKIEVGKTYSIVVSTPDGRQVSASATVPSPVNIKEIKLDSGVAVNISRNFNARDVKEYYIKLIWQDVAGSVDFYRGFGLAQGIFTDRNNSTVSRIDGIDFTSTDDKNSDGQLLALNVTYQPSRNSTKATLQKLTVGLFHADINYFNYHESLRKQRSNNNPFAEPVLLFSNVKGGFGCFGAYNANWLDLKLK